MARKYGGSAAAAGTRTVRSFGENRICAAPGCDTRLSRYNPDLCCSVHRDLLPAQPIGRWLRA